MIARDMLAQMATRALRDAADLQTATAVPRMTIWRSDARSDATPATYEAKFYVLQGRKPKAICDRTFRRSIEGTYISVEPVHLGRYVDEHVFRYNHRGGTDADRFTAAVSGVSVRRLTYAALTGAR